MLMETTRRQTEKDIPGQFAPNLFQFWQLVSQPQKKAPQLRERYQDFVVTRYGGQQGVVALTPEGARQILLGNPASYDAFWQEGFTGVAGPGSIWVLGGKQHQRERQLLVPAFHGSGFSKYGETIRKITKQHIQNWQPDQVIRTIDTTLSISLNVIMQIVFGSADTAEMQAGQQVLSKLLKTYNPLIVFFPRLQRWWFPPWRKHVQAKADFSNWLQACIEQRRASASQADDLLGRMLLAEYQDGGRMRDEDIRDELVTILLAGHETTATALAWALYELARHPQVLQKLRAELATLGPEPDIDQLVKLPYLTAVCNETMRLHTLLPEVARVLTAPLDFFGYQLQPGNYVMVSIMAIHRDPQLYLQPEQFIPERFLERTFSPFEFLPFGGGHRRCLGASLSDFEFRISLAKIAQQWELEAPFVEREIRHDIAMGPKNGVLLRVKARKPKPAA